MIKVRQQPQQQQQQQQQKSFLRTLPQYLLAFKKLLLLKKAIEAFGCNLVTAWISLRLVIQGAHKTRSVKTILGQFGLSVEQQPKEVCFFPQRVSLSGKAFVFHKASIRGVFKQNPELSFFELICYYFHKLRLGD